MKTWTRLQKLTVLATLVYAVVFVFMLIVRPGSRQFYDAFFNTYQIFPPLLAGITGILYYRSVRDESRYQRIRWLLIALACLSFTMGQCTWTYLESVKGVEVPFPSLADVWFVGTYLFLVTGLLLLFGSMPAAGCARQLMDSAIAAGSLGVLSWHFLIQRIWQQSDMPFIGKLASIAYPLGDISLLFVAGVLLSSPQQNRMIRRSVYFLACGVLGFVIFDTSFTWMTMNGTYRTGSWSDWSLSFGWIAVGYAFLIRMWSTEKTQDDSLKDEAYRIQPRSIRQMIVPYIAVVAACLIIGIHDAYDGYYNSSTVAASAFLMLLVIVRQIFALVENQALNLQLKRFNDDLEKTVALRTGELEAQNKKVLALIEERNRFFRHVSHEVRTPLTSVIGFSEMLMEDEDEPPSPGQTRHLEKVITNAHRLLGIINDLLDISKIEAGRMEVNYSEVDLAELVEQVAESITPLASEKALEIRMDIPHDLPRITTDEQKLAQILLNLLSNAVKYTLEGTIYITAVANTESVLISVKDTGIGIPQAELENIFKEFYRVQGGPLQRGTGLGLTIAEKFSALLGGSISVQSKPENGSTFSLALPLEPQLP